MFHPVPRADKGLKRTDSSSTRRVAPDGGIHYSAQARENLATGELIRCDDQGKFNACSSGWLTTAPVPHPNNVPRSFEKPLSQWERGFWPGEELSRGEGP